MSVRRSAKRKKLRLPTWKAHKYQARAVARGLTQKFLAYFLDPGLGKTTIILQLFKILKWAGLVRGMLVIAPLRPCYLVWPKEIEKWANFHGLSYRVLHKEWPGDMTLTENKDIYIINPEGLPWLLKKLKGKRKDTWPFDMLVVDESTKFKNMGTKRFQRLKKIIPKMSRRYILTGTPMPNGIENIQGQFAIVDMGETFGMTKKYFRGKYLKQIGRPEWGQFVPRSEEHLEDIYRKSAKYAMRMKGSDYLDLPERVNNFIWVKLPRKAMKHYREVENEMFTELDNGKTISGDTPAAITIKCHQVANGRVYEDIDPLAPRPKKKDRKVLDIHKAKLDALTDLWEELNHKPLLIAYRFEHDLEALKKHFGKDLVSMGSNVSMRQCQRIEKRWNQGRIKLLACYPGTSALGLNLQEQGQDVVWYSIIDDQEAYDQFIKRLERQGSAHNHIRNHLLLAKRTVDEIKYNNIERKDHEQLTYLQKIEYYRKNKVA